MTTPNLSTVYCKAVAKTLLAMRGGKDTPALSYFLGVDDHIPCKVQQWGQLISDVAIELKCLLRDDPANADAFFIGVIECATPGADDEYYDICSNIYLADLRLLCARSRTDDRLRHALAAVLLTRPHMSFDTAAFSAMTSDIARKEVVLKEPRPTWQAEMLSAFFGPAWQALYEGDMLSDASVIRHVLLEKPPFDQVPASVVISESVPQDLTM